MKTKYYWEVRHKTVLKACANGKHIRIWNSLNENGLGLNYIETHLYNDTYGLVLGNAEYSPQITYRQFLMWYVDFVSNPLNWKGYSHVD